MKSLAVLASLGLASLALSARGDDPPADKPVQGTWRPVSAELAGAPFPGEVLKTMKLVLDKDKYTVFVGEQADEGTVTSDPKKTPKAMDIKGTNGPNKGKTLLAIYELKGDELRICYDLSGKSRPTEFASAKGTKQFLVNYQPIKP